MIFEEFKDIWSLCEKLPHTDGEGFPGFFSSYHKVAIKYPSCHNSNIIWENGFSQIDEVLRFAVDRATNAFLI